MTEIEHFRLRIARRGWVRGEAAERILETAKRVLPEAVGERFAAVWPGADGEVSEPVHLRLSVTLGELSTALGNEHALDALLAKWIPGQVSPMDGVESATTSDLANLPVHGASQLALEPATGLPSPGDVLVGWRAIGMLETFLEAFTADALELWHHAVLHERSPAPSPRAKANGVANTALTAFAQDSTVTANTRTAVLRRRIVAIVEWRIGGSLPGSRARAEMLDRVFPLPDPPAEEHGTKCVPAEPRSGTRRLQPIPVAVTRTAALRPAPHGCEVAIQSALPFLLVRSLARLGYLDAIAASFAVAERSIELPTFAAALALRVLAPLERGWRRSVAACEAAAAFAGLMDLPSESEIATLAADASTLTSPLDALITRSLLRGHDPARPLLVVGHGADRLLVEPEGLFLIASGSQVAAALTGCDATIVICASAADPELLAEIQARALRFVTPAPPTRHEHWRRLRHSSALWSNDPQTPDHVLARASNVLELESDVHELAAAFAVRRVVPLDRNGALDRSLALAVAAALGDIAFTMWREREPTSPTLALTRLGDLAARVRFLDREIDVRIPLGPRQSDLEMHHFLGTSQVPWLPGHTLVVRGG